MRDFEVLHTSTQRLNTPFVLFRQIEKVPKSTLQQVYLKWKKSNHTHTILGLDEMLTVIVLAGLPTTLPKANEKQIEAAALKHSDDETLLTKSDLLPLAGRAIKMFFRTIFRHVSFTNTESTWSWFRVFVARNPEFHERAVRTTENARTTATTTERVYEHVARVDAAIKRFNIREPALIFSLD